jgi:hypothetical protein
MGALHRWNIARKSGVGTARMRNARPFALSRNILFVAPYSCAGVRRGGLRCCNAHLARETLALVGLRQGGPAALAAVARRPVSRGEMMLNGSTRAAAAYSDRTQSRNAASVFQKARLRHGISSGLNRANSRASLPPVGSDSASAR